MENIFFNSSLPRSGSTLLQNILAQNPDFYATPTSGLLELLYTSRAAFSKMPEFKAQDPMTMYKAFTGFCRAGLHGYFKDITDKKYVIDKSRGWAINQDFLKNFHDNPKIVCMLRDPIDIFTSLEKKFRENQHIELGIINGRDIEGTTVKKRIDHFANNLPLGLSLDNIHDLIVRRLDKNILFIKFEDLTQNPQAEMNKVYDYFEVERFEHDFNNIEQITQEDDKIHGVFGDHKIRREVRPLKSQAIEILGADNCEYIKEKCDWFYREFKY